MTCAGRRSKNLHLLEGIPGRRNGLTLIQHRTRTRYALLIASLLAYPAISFASRPLRAQARSDYDRAARMRTTLEGQPETALTGLNQRE